MKRIIFLVGLLFSSLVGGADSFDNPIPDNPLPDNSIPDNPLPDNPVPDNSLPDNPI